MHNSFRIDCRILPNGGLSSAICVANYIERDTALECRILPNAGLSSAIWVGNIERETAFALGLITSTLAVSLRFTG